MYWTSFILFLSNSWGNGNLIIYVHVPAWVYVYGMHVDAGSDKRRLSDFLKWVTDGYKSPDGCAGNQTRVVYKGSKCSHYRVVAPFSTVSIALSSLLFLFQYFQSLVINQNIKWEIPQMTTIHKVSVW